MNNDVFFPFNIYLLQKENDNYKFCVNAGYINSQISRVYNGEAYKWAIPPEYTNEEYTNENPYYPRNLLNLPLQDFDDNLKGDLVETFTTNKTCDVYLSIPKIPIGHYSSNKYWNKKYWYYGTPPYDYINQFNIVTSNDEGFEEKYIKNTEIKGDIGDPNNSFSSSSLLSDFNYIDEVKYPGRIYIKIANIEIKNNDFFIKYFFKSNVIAPIKYFRLGALSMRHIRIIYKTVSKFKSESWIRLDEASNEKKQGSELGESVVGSGGGAGGGLELSGLESGSLRLGRLDTGSLKIGGLKSGGLEIGNLEGAKTLQKGSLEASDSLGSKKSSQNGSDTNGVVPDNETNNSGGDTGDGDAGSDEESGGPDTDIEVNNYDMGRIYINPWVLSEAISDFESPYLFDKPLAEIETLCQKEITKKINFINQSYFYGMFNGVGYSQDYQGRKYKKEDLQVYQIILIYQENIDGKIICKNLFENIDIYNSIAKNVFVDNEKLYSSTKKDYNSNAQYIEKKPMTTSEVYNLLSLEKTIRLEKIDPLQEENSEEKSDKPPEYEEISLDLDKIVELINFEKDENEESPKGSGDAGEDNGRGLEGGGGLNEGGGGGLEGGGGL